MTKYILGAYDYEEDAIQAVNEYELAGYKADELTILTNRNKKTNHIQNVTDVKVQEGSAFTGDDTFWKKIKKAITEEGTANVSAYDQLLNYDVAQEDAERFTANGNANRIYILTDEIVGKTPFR